MTNHTSGAADLPEALRIEDALKQADRAEAAALSYGEGTTLGIEAYAAAKTIRALHSRLAALAAAPPQPTQAQAGAVPLTHGVLADLLDAAWKDFPDHPDTKMHFAEFLARRIEAAHGIKEGGQHAAD